MTFDDYEMLVQKIKRLSFLYYMGIPIPSPYSDIFKALDDFYDCHETVELSDTAYQRVLCGMDKDLNILFVLKNTNNVYDVTLIHTEKYSALVGYLIKLYKTFEKKFIVIDMALNLANKIVANRKGLVFINSTFYSSKTYYIKYLKSEYMKNSKIQTLALGQHSKLLTF